ncbi:MAG: peptidoglycan DD-metalloendopeptidase family protein [Crocinitomix sp.]|nr:peptidoglycan DD-metalloendopeptidase family protein [Crocinitomix sp.]
MSFLEKIKNYFRRSREKHKLTFINDSNYHEKWSLRVSSFNLISLLGLYTLVVLVLSLVLVKYTPLNSLFVSDNSFGDEQEIERQGELIDSLYQATESNQFLLNNLKTILSEEDFVDSTTQNRELDLENYQPDFTKSVEDSMLRKKVENAESNKSRYAESESYDFFFAPVNGLVSRSFNENEGHFGVDIVTLKDEPIKSCLEGTIILTGWIQSEGKVVVVQHKGDLISVYKHCSAILKQRGEQVETGDPIAIVGNSGENTTGPHLHFELWKKGYLLNPEEYISF